MANQTTSTPKALKTVRSHAGYSRLLYGGDFRLDGSGLPVKLGEVKRPLHIPSPYYYGAEWSVYEYRGKPVVVAETSHKVYQVFSAEGLEPVQPVVSEGETRAEQIEKKYREYDAILGELKGKESLGGTSWYEDRLELARVKLSDILDLEGAGR